MTTSAITIERFQSAPPPKVSSRLLQAKELAAKEFKLQEIRRNRELKELQKKAEHEQQERSLSRQTASPDVDLKRQSTPPARRPQQTVYMLGKEVAETDAKPVLKRTLQQQVAPRRHTAPSRISSPISRISPSPIRPSPKVSRSHVHIQPGRIALLARNEVTERAKGTPRLILDVHHKKEKQEFAIPSRDANVKVSKSGLIMKNKLSELESMRDETDSRLQKAFDSMIRRQQPKTIKPYRKPKFFEPITSKNRGAVISPKQPKRTKSASPPRRAPASLTKFEVETPTKEDKETETKPPFKTGIPNFRPEPLNPPSPRLLRK
jgi:DNA primase